MNGQACGRRRIAIDFSAIKTGGGVQRALTFLRSLHAEPWPEVSVFYVLPPSGALSSLRAAHAPDAVHAPSRVLARLWFEYVTWPRLLRARQIDAVFTFFGAGLPHPRQVASVVGVAYPIICYPESPFWNHLSRLPRIRQRLKNAARISRLRSASLIVAETAVMAERLARTLSVARDRIAVVPPSPTEWVNATRDLSPRPFTFLFLSGVSPHKNLWRLPAVASALRRLTSMPFVFLLSIRRDAFDAGLSDRLVIDSGVIETCFEFVGAVAESEVGSLYRRSDVLVNLSDLESFSNNYMEAWSAGLPQIASDRDFARSICENSAWYADPHDPEAVARAMALAMTDDAGRALRAAAGRLLLETLPSQADATRQLHSLILGAVAERASSRI